MPNYKGKFRLYNSHTKVARGKKKTPKNHKKFKILFIDPTWKKRKKKKKKGEKNRIKKEKEKRKVETLMIP